MQQMQHRHQHSAPEFCLNFKFNLSGRILIISLVFYVIVMMFTKENKRKEAGKAAEVQLEI